MGLAETINQSIKDNRLICTAQKIINGMKVEDKEATESAIVLLQSGEARFSATWLTKQVNVEGYKVSISTFTKHISKGCCCESK